MRVSVLRIRLSSIVSLYNILLSFSAYIIQQIDAVERKLVFLAADERSAGKEIRIDDILGIHGKLVDYMDDM